MSWIDTLNPNQAQGPLKALYERVSGPNGAVDNILQAHSLRPHTLEGHMALYKAVLHHRGNRLPRTLLETLGVYVSLLNGCDYCVQHHLAGLKKLLGDDVRVQGWFEALAAGRLEGVFDARQRAALGYARKLTQAPATMQASDVTGLKEVGFNDGEVLEINQVVAYFAYANRTVLGLGVTTDGDELGLSPSDAKQPGDWTHR